MMTFEEKTIMYNKNSDITKYLRNFTSAQYLKNGRVSVNHRFLNYWIEGVLYSYGVNSLLSKTISFDRMEGVLLDNLGEWFLGIDRLVDETIDPSGKLSDSEYLIVLKFAIAAKNAYPSVINLTNLLRMFFGDNTWVSEGNGTIQYVFSDTNINAKIVKALVEKKLLPKPAGIVVSAVITTGGNKFFNFPISSNGGIPVYRAFETGKDGGVIYSENRNILPTA